MLLRIILVGAMLGAFMIYAKQERVLMQIGFVGECVPSLPTSNAAPATRSSQWWSCSEGTLLGYPSLNPDACRSAGLAGSREMWYCLDPISNPT